MAESRARESFFASHCDLFRSIVEIDPRTAVPKEGLCVANYSGANGGPGPVLCVLSSCAAPVAADASLDLQPRYDVLRRELCLAGFVMKRFKKPAGNQEAILKAFQEESELNDGLWPPKIDDPISGGAIEPIKRLHKALDALNAAIMGEVTQSAATHSIKFFTDGTGQAIRWKVVAVATSAGQVL